MRVALINNAPRTAGVGRYAFETQEHIGKSGVEVAHYLFNRKEWALDKIADTGFERIHQSFRNPLIDNALLMKFGRLPNLLLDLNLARLIPAGYDLYHITNQNMSDITFCSKISPSIITVHDIIFYVYYNLAKKHFGRLVYLGLKNCNKIIAVSESTKKDLVKYFNVPGNKIRVIHPGVSQNFKPLSKSERNKIYGKYGLTQDRRYLMHVGSPEPRKNVGTLIKAFHKIVTQNQFRDVHLIKINKLSKTDEAMIAELGIQNNITVLDNVPEESLVGFYNIAYAFILPSFYEGFGFPILEAMACGTPVISSSTSSIPEVMGGAGILLNPRDEKGFTEAIVEILLNDKLRAEMKLKGLQRAESFSWDYTAAETLKTYQELT